MEITIQQKVAMVAIVRFTAIHQLAVVAVRQPKTGTGQCLTPLREAVVLAAAQGLRLL
jgi:hypothetical protein